VNLFIIQTDCAYIKTFDSLVSMWQQRLPDNHLNATWCLERFTFHKSPFHERETEQTSWCL